MARLDTPERSPDDRQEPTRQRQDYEEFRETLAAPVPNQTYREQYDQASARPSTTEQVIRYAATILTGLLALRFITHLFSNDASNGWVNFVQTLTDWLVAPFQGFVGTSSLSTGGYIDLPSLASLVLIVLLATALIRLMRPRPV